jgi:uncharacterized membrane protein YraQ (UPF0718 family)
LARPRIVEGLFGISVQTHLGASLHFFFYDVPKVLTLVLAVSFAVGFVQTWLEPESVRRWLAASAASSECARGLGRYRDAFLFLLGGASVYWVPGRRCTTGRYLFVSGGGAHVNEVAVALLWGLFGVKVTAVYIGFGVTLALVTGYAVGLMKLEKWVEPFVWKCADLAAPRS